MGAFCSTPQELLHQLAAILPINIHLKKLVSQVAIHLLTLPASSPVLHHLGQPWCSEQGSRVPLPYPLPAHPPNSCIRQLIQLVPADSHRPPMLDLPPWRRCLPLANCFTVSQTIHKGKEWKKLINSIIKSHHDGTDHLLLYCRAMGPNPTQTQPTWTAACVAYCQGQEVGHQTSVPGQNASARDTAFQALADTACLAKDLLVGSSSPSSISILTADHLVLPYCQITDHHNNTMTCRTICNLVSAILATHTTTILSISWIPSKISFRLLEHLMTIGVEAAA
jgi:hypothetical protein